MSMRLISLFSLVCALIACQPPVEQGKDEALRMGVKPLIRSSDMGDSVSAPIHIPTIKELSGITLTSSILPAMESLKPIGTCAGEFLGFYFLIDERIGTPIGKLTVLVQGSPASWQASNLTEQFVQIDLSVDKFPVWGCLRIGSQRGALISLFSPYTVVNHDSLVLVQCGPYLARFDMERDTVRRITITQCCYQCLFDQTYRKLCLYDGDYCFKQSEIGDLTTQLGTYEWQGDTLIMKPGVQGLGQVKTTLLRQADRLHYLNRDRPSRLHFRREN